MMRSAAIPARVATMLISVGLLLAGFPARAATTPFGIGKNDRVLVIAPHPDDETLCCSGFMRHALAAGATVQVAWVTSGDAFELDAALIERRLIPGKTSMRRLAEDRMLEANAAASLLGVAQAQRYFLGFPDRGIKHLLTVNYYKTYTSRYTGASTVPYPEAVAPGTAYRGQLLEQQLEDLVNRIRPTLILIPTPLDRHPDHSAVGEFMVRVLARLGLQDRARYWIVHGGREWPAPRRYRPALALSPPRVAAQLVWSVLPLDAADRAAKLAALRLYQTQWRVMEPFLASFVRTNELFSEIAYPPELELPRLSD